MIAAKIINSASIALLALGTLAAPALAQSALAQSAGTPPADGHRLFVQSCAVCHLKPSPVAKTYGPELGAGVAQGQAEMVRAAIVNGSAKMPSFKYDLAPSEMDAIVAYLTTPASQAAGVHAAAEPAAPGASSGP